MRRAVLAVAAACLLLGPTALAFFSGGFYGEPRLIAAIVAWVLVLALAVLGPAPLPRGRAGVATVAGLVALLGWSALSLTWAPLGGPAVDSVQRLLLYLGALLLAIGVFHAAPLAARTAEPVLAAGATIVIGYGLAGRLLPGIVELSRSERAGGRLEQPITYWNGEGALAAVGLVLCARIAGDRSRPPWMRALAAAAAVLLAAGVYLSYSRAALAVAVIGVVVVVAAAPSRTQLRAAVVVLAAGVAAGLASAAFPGVAALEGDDRTRDGALALILLLALAGAAAFTALRLRLPWTGDDSPAARAAPGTAAADSPPRWARHAAPVAAALVVLAGVGLLAGALAERPSEAELSAGASASRLTTVSSNRYEYWRVGLEAFRRDPLTGTGAGGFRVAWLQERRLDESVRDAHSLELEVLAELGLPGLLALLLMVGGAAAAARRALRADRAVAAGATAATLTWFLHASLDWDWQLPAVSLPAIVLAGLLITQEGRSAGPAAGGPRAPARRPPDRVRG